MQKKNGPARSPSCAISTKGGRIISGCWGELYMHMLHGYPTKKSRRGGRYFGHVRFAIKFSTQPLQNHTKTKNNYTHTHEWTWKKKRGFGSNKSTSSKQELFKMKIYQKRKWFVKWTSFGKFRWCEKNSLSPCFTPWECSRTQGGEPRGGTPGGGGQGGGFDLAKIPSVTPISMKAKGGKDPEKNDRALMCHGWKRDLVGVDFKKGDVVGIHFTSKKLCWNATLWRHMQPKRSKHDRDR